MNKSGQLQNSLLVHLFQKKKSSNQLWKLVPCNDMFDAKKHWNADPFRKKLPTSYQSPSVWDYVSKSDSQSAQKELAMQTLHCNNGTMGLAYFGKIIIRTQASITANIEMKS